jgi:hypothetical protein
MKRVAQVDENGCGAACVATIGRVSYFDAVKLVGRSNTSAAVLRKALRSCGMKLGKRISLKGKTYSDLKQDGLLAARISQVRTEETWGHWLVWDASSQAIIDPSKMPISSRRTRIVAFFPIST